MRKNSFYAQNVNSSRKIEIFLSCRELQNKDLFSLSDPYIIVKLNNQNQMLDNAQSDNKPDKNSQWCEIYRTNIIYDNLNPNFHDTFILDYKFEEYQQLKFEVYDYDSETKSDFLGQVECSIGEIVRQQNQTLVLDLFDENNRLNFNSNKRSKNGRIIIRYDEVYESNDVCQFQISTRNLKPVRSFLNPFIRIYRKQECSTTDHILVYESNSVKKNFMSKKITLKGQKLNNCDYNVPTIFEIWDKGFCGRHLLIGKCEATINQLKYNSDYANEEKQENIFNLTQNFIPYNQEITGILIFEKCQVIQLPSFLDYLRGGTSINLQIGIDFTASNGHSSTQDSLHYNNPNNKSYNLYQRALYAVGNILLEYDSDKLVPTFGFGALISGQLSHCFEINGKKNQAEIQGIGNILLEYKNILQKIEFSGPTYFCPLIQKCMSFAQNSLNQFKDDYYVLLILTDGEIHDMEQTKRIIIDCSRLPISIIIVGIGNADFQNMETLDGDQGLVDQRGRKAERDLVQFVEFKKYQNNDILLTREVLKELPYQIIEYNLLNKKLPQGFEQLPGVDYIQFTRIINSQENLKQPLVYKWNYFYLIIVLSFLFYQFFM